MSYYLLWLPEEFDIRSLELLLTLLAKDATHRAPNFSQVLEHDFFKHNNPLISKAQFQAENPDCFNNDGFYRLIKIGRE
jgi:hypothetical protein